MLRRHLDIAAGGLHDTLVKIKSRPLPPACPCSATGSADSRCNTADAIPKPLSLIRMRARTR
ncbi:hypothetical protein GJA_2688 [Janthinobacterium agaricidamnosum NBRC 102515 = DSM 9628]|uniref:Uncharacterized protein n=1 Tax=Janthinobacterium agaricidamnosum NBRC 102515 = DSM 9628 TaxID=1349767 RepID=W0V3A9_9BURK|nr:hypothetical protein GJA_2688 [Janthinobacterium agaricidamnosum NBRC 102515 = DSM 9628]